MSAAGVASHRNSRCNYGSIAAGGISSSALPFYAASAIWNRSHLPPAASSLSSH